jgi:hypothetical protein
MEPAGLLEDIERERDAVASELALDPFEGALHREPKVDLLAGRPARRVAREPGRRLDRLDPRRHRLLEARQEGRVRDERLGLDRRGRDALAGGPRALDCGSDRRMDNQRRVRDLDVLLEMEERQLELGELLLGHGDACE